VVQTTEERQPEPEISAEDAAREVALSLAAFADLARTGQLPLEAIESLRSASRRFLEDDLRPQPPIGVEGDRVDMMVGSEETSDANGAVQH
jgi:hypothetical protein